MEMNSRNDNQSEMLMTVKIQTFENQFPLDIKRDSTVKELKEKILEKFNIPIENQRLIFQGKLMKNEEKLLHYKVSDESVIHLVARSIEETNNHNDSQTRTQIGNDNNTVIQQDNNETRVDDVVPIVDIPFFRSRRQRRRRIPQFDISECFESLHQNITTVQNLINCKNTFDKIQIEQTKTIIPFDMTKSKYEVGQWVDVKDTIDQWLEAQVIQVRNNQAYVHYNGWGTRWDEWIDFSSPRIAPLRTYTVQHPSSIFLTPYPHIPCDSNVEPQQRSIDALYYMEKTNYFMSEVEKMMQKMSKLRNTQNMHIANNKRQLENNESEILFLASQMIPIMDRCGRMMSDVSMQLSHLILNSNLSSKLLFNKDQLEEERFPSSQNNTSSFRSSTNQDSNLNIPSAYDLSTSSSELPFIQRLNSSVSEIHTERLDPKYKVNLQVPTILSPGDSSLLRGQNDSNIDIYVHTVITPSRQRSNSTNVNVPSQTNQLTFEGNRSNNSNNTSDIISSRERVNSMNNNNNTNLNTNPESNRSNSVTSLLDNIMNMISRRTNTNGVNTNGQTNVGTGSNEDENFQSISEEVIHKDSDTEEFEECYDLNQGKENQNQSNLNNNNLNEK